MADLKLLERLCRAHGISGREDAVRKIILEEVRPYADEISVDPLGNILIHKNGESHANHRLLLDAHMDEVGMLVTGITENGFLNIVNVGGIDSGIQCGIQVEVGEAHIPGVIGMKPVHICKGGERNELPHTDELTVDIGAKNREDAEKYVLPGDTVCFAPYFETSGDSILGKALDNRAGCALLIELLRKPSPYDFCVSFSVQEEVGLRGAKAASFALCPESAIAVEATTAADIPGIPPDKHVCTLGEGPAISFMDGRTIYDHEYYKLALRRASELGIKAQSKRAASGGNNAGAIHTSRAGVRTLAVSLPCRYLHSPIGMININDYDAALELLCDLVMQLACDRT